MKARITRICYINQLHTLGDDHTIIEMFFCLESGVEVKTPVLASYKELLHFIESTQPETAQYLKNIRKNLNGYGSKDSKVFEIITANGFDLDPYVYKYFETLEPEKIMDSMAVSGAFFHNTNLDVTASFEKLMAELDDALDGFKEDNLKYIQFQEAIDEALEKVSCQYCENLLGKGNPYVFAFKELVTQTTLFFTKEIREIYAGRFAAFHDGRYHKEKFQY
jgi:hypothetical protein